MRLVGAVATHEGDEFTGCCNRVRVLLLLDFFSGGFIPAARLGHL